MASELAPNDGFCKHSCVSNTLHSCVSNTLHSCVSDTLHSCVSNTLHSCDSNTLHSCDLKVLKLCGSTAATVSPIHIRCGSHPKSEPENLAPEAPGVVWVPHECGSLSSRGPKFTLNGLAAAAFVFHWWQPYCLTRYPFHRKVVCHNSQGMGGICLCTKFGTAQPSLGGPAMGRPPASLDQPKRLTIAAWCSPSWTDLGEIESGPECL